MYTDYCDKLHLLTEIRVRALVIYSIHNSKRLYISSVLRAHKSIIRSETYVYKRDHSKSPLFYTRLALTSHSRVNQSLCQRPLSKDIAYNSNVHLTLIEVEKSRIGVGLSWKTWKSRDRQSCNSDSINFKS